MNSALYKNQFYNTELADLLGWKFNTIKQTWSGESRAELMFSGPLTFEILKTVSEYFGTEDIDIEGGHGHGSYDFGFEVELTVSGITRNG